jgi:hypothetical protein
MEMGRLLRNWLRLLEDEEAHRAVKVWREVSEGKTPGWFSHPESISGDLDNYLKKYKEGGDPIELMRAFNMLIQYRFPLPAWAIEGLDKDSVIEGLDKVFDTYRPFPKKTGIKWLTHREVMNQWGIDQDQDCNLKLARHIWNDGLPYYIVEGKWLSEEAQAIRKYGVIIYQGRTWIDKKEITLDRIVKHLSDLVFSVEDVIEFEKNREIKIKPDSQKENLADNRFERNVDIWNISFGRKNTTIKDLKGIYDIACLLDNKPNPIAAVDLYNRNANPITDSTAISLSKMSGKELEEYNLRKGSIEDRTTVKITSKSERERIGKALQECIRELKKAKENDDPESYAMIPELEKQKADLMNILLGKAEGKAVTEERARKAVANRINIAMKKIRKDNKALGDHLFRSIRPGKYFSYEPEEEISWAVKM